MNGETERLQFIITVYMPHEVWSLRYIRRLLSLWAFLLLTTSGTIVFKHSLTISLSDAFDEFCYSQDLWMVHLYRPLLLLMLHLLYLYGISRTNFAGGEVDEVALSWYVYHVDLRGILLSLCKKILLRSTSVQVLTCSDGSAQLDLTFEKKIMLQMVR